MTICYKRLWKLLIDRDMKKKDLRELTGLSVASMAKLAKNRNVNTDVLLRICEALKCDLEDIAEVVNDESSIEGKREGVQMNTEALYLSIGQALNAQQSQMFGKPCFKVNGKAFICFFQNEMVFKLTDTMHELAVGLHGAKLFDPSEKGRPMKEWVQVPAAHLDRWALFAKAAMDYVNKGE